MTTEELRILNGCIKGERKWQEKLYQKYSPKMFGVCLGYSPDYDMAQDLLQEGFIKVFKNIKKCNGDGSLEGWIRRVIVNNTIDHYRSKGHQYSFTELNETHFFEHDFYIENESIKKFDKDDFLSITRGLPDGYRLVLNMYVIEGYKHKEIAEKLNITEGTSKSQLAKAKKFLRKKLEKFINSELLEDYGLKQVV